MYFLIILFIIIAAVSNILDKSLKLTRTDKKSKDRFWGEIEKSILETKKDTRYYVNKDRKANINSIDLQRNVEAVQEYSGLEGGSIEDEGLEDIGMENSDKGEPVSLEDVEIFHDTLEGKQEANQKAEAVYNMVNDETENNDFCISFLKDDIVKAFIYKEIFDNPLCKRDAR